MQKLEIKRFTSKMLGANTYILFNDNHGIIIDPCTKVDIVREFCHSNKIQIELILLTHCHIDHTLYLNEYINEFKVPFAIHSKGNRGNMNENLNGARLFGMKKSFKSADILLNDGDKIIIGQQTAEIIWVPGHSEGSVCVYADNLLISGDTLFNLSIGRSDLPGGDQNKLKNSLQKLMNLPENTIVYPGHGSFTTIKYEKENNPFL